MWKKSISEKKEICFDFRGRRVSDAVAGKLNFLPRPRASVESHFFSTNKEKSLKIIPDAF